MTGRPPVGLCVVNWNGEDLLPDALQALGATEYDGAIRLVVIDNASTDGSVALVEERFDAVEVWRRTENNYAAACQQAMQDSEEPYVALVNSDARPEPGWLEPLVAALEADDRAAAAQGKILLPDGTLNSTGIEELPERYWQDRGFRMVDDGRYDGDGPEAVFGCSGCCLLLRREAALEAGGFDAGFEMYYEDVDLALKLAAAGLKSLFVPRSVTRHLYNASVAKVEQTGQDLPKDVLGERNRLYVVARHFPSELAEVLATSRFFLTRPPAEMAAALPDILARWEESEPDAGARSEFLAGALAAVRAVVDEREGWARSSDVEIEQREDEMKDLAAALAKRDEEVAETEAELQARADALETLEAKAAEAARAVELERETAAAEREHAHELEGLRSAAEALANEKGSALEEANAHNIELTRAVDRLNMEKAGLVDWVKDLLAEVSKRRFLRRDLQDAEQAFLDGHHDAETLSRREKKAR